MKSRAWLDLKYKSGNYNVGISELLKTCKVAFVP